MVAIRQQAPLSPSNSFRKFRATFSPLSPAVSNSGMSSPSCSPSRSTSTGRLSFMSTNSFRQIRSFIRRSPSTIELEQEEERRECTDELLGLVEPRPNAETHVGGIEEVLFGRLFTEAFAPGLGSSNSSFC